jgi:hypothetical protein
MCDRLIIDRERSQKTMKLGSSSLEGSTCLFLGLLIRYQRPMMSSVETDELRRWAAQASWRLIVTTRSEVLSSKILQRMVGVQCMHSLMLDVEEGIVLC